MAYPVMPVSPPQPRERVVVLSILRAVLTVPICLALSAISPTIVVASVHFIIRMSSWAVRFFGVPVIGPPALCFLPVVLNVGAGREMPWVNARRVVARMQNVQPVRNRPNSQLERNTVSTLRLATPACLANTPQAYSPIPVLVMSAHPRPTVVWTANTNVVPKGFRGYAPRRHAVLPSRMVCSGSVGGSPLLPIRFYFTPQTGEWNEHQR